MGSQVTRAIARALADSASAYAARGIRVESDLRAQGELATEEPVLEQALYTIFRALPHRLAPGATLRVTAVDRAGGDVEVVWEAVETEEAAGPAAPATGPYGDLIELALTGLITLCRARAGEVRLDDETLRFSPGVRRRYLFLIPTLAHDRTWHPRR